jgi:hypothetical protein
LAACIDALALAVPGGGAGGGGDKLPTPNSPGEALGDDGSASGAAWLVYCALVRSATSPSVSFFIASRSGGSGLAGTEPRFG